MRTRSGWVSRARSTASLPLEARTTSKPSSSRNSWYSSRASLKSSATRITGRARADFPQGAADMVSIMGSGRPGGQPRRVAGSRGWRGLAPAGRPASRGGRGSPGAGQARGSDVVPVEPAGARAARSRQVEVGPRDPVQAGDGDVHQAELGGAPQPAPENHRDE